MSERELKSITFEDLGITYVIPSSGSSSGDVPKVVEDHINNKNNPHGVTAAQIDAAPAQIISGSIQPSTAEDLETQLKEMYTNMGINTRKFAYANITSTDTPLGGGIWQLTLAKTTDAYGFIIAENYTSAATPNVMARTIYNGVWNDWVDVGASAFAPSGYGLGTNPTAAQDIDTLTKCGWYKCVIPGGYLNNVYVGGNVLVRVDGYSEAYATQTVYGTPSDMPIVSRKMFNGEWKEWESNNPPMNVNVEYRTTMYDNGKALYLERGDNGAIFYRRDGEDQWYGMASCIDGTFANVVAANPTAQDPATRQLRNSTIVSAEATPSYNGEICWVYE